MEIEDISKIDLFLKINQNFQSILDIDNLIIIDNDPNSIKDLKNSAYRLTKIENDNNNDELFQTWKYLFSKQVKFSVQRAKEKSNDEKN